VLEFQFKEETHEYFLNGVRIPGVTEILENVGISDFSMVPKETLERAQRRGTRVHKICELWDRDKLNLDSLTLEDMGYLEAWNGFLDSLRVPRKDLVLNETPLFSEKLFYAGTEDRYYRAGLLVDIKTGASERAHGPQTAAYAQLIKEKFNLRANAVIDRYVAHLFPDGTFKAVLQCERKDWNIFQSAKNVFTFKNGG